MARELPRRHRLANRALRRMGAGQDPGASGGAWRKYNNGRAWPRPGRRMPFWATSWSMVQEPWPKTPRHPFFIRGSRGDVEVAACLRRAGGGGRSGVAPGEIVRGGDAVGRIDGGNHISHESSVYSVANSCCKGASAMEVKMGKLQEQWCDRLGTLRRPPADSRGLRQPERMPVRRVWRPPSARS